VQTGDVSALLLTVGEPYAERALASIQRQTMPPAAVVAVRNVVPFHRALNQGAAQIGTPFFVQVDADMILDAGCFADLRAGVGERVGTVIGHLRDPLLGRVAGIKLFRTACFAEARFADSISPDTEFENAIARSDWRTIYAIKPPHGPALPAHVFGDHCPAYTPLYTFRKFQLLGARHRYRRAGASLRGMCRALRASGHEAALFALVGTAHGIFQATDRDRLEPFADGTDFQRLASLLARTPQRAVIVDELGDAGELDDSTAWRRGYRYGLLLARDGDRQSLAAICERLIDHGGALEWVAFVGVCQGLFADAYDEAQIERDFTLLNPITPKAYRRR